MKTPLAYGLREGILTSIRHVPSGLACNCLCPACLQPLIARKGDSKAHHFAHHRSPDCPFAGETMLHLMAKNILAAEKQIKLPPLFVGAYPLPILPARMFYFDHVWLEHKIHDVIPDLFVQKGRKKLFIEIACTHPCPLSKQKIIKRLGIAALEIDLSPMISALSAAGEPLEEQTVRRSLIDSDDNRNWLFNPKQNALEKALRERSERKNVKSIGKGERAVLCVHPCPRKKRRWKKGFLKNQTYAQVFRDCLHCPYCLQIQYREALRGYQWAPTVPEKVYCWANEREWLEQFKYPFE